MNKFSTFSGCLLFLSILLCVSGENSGCSETGDHSNGGLCYHKFSAGKTWEEADQECNSWHYGSHLTSLADVTERNYVFGTVFSGASSGMIGLHKGGSGSPCLVCPNPGPCGAAPYDLSAYYWTDGSPKGQLESGALVTNCNGGLEQACFYLLNNGNIEDMDCSETTREFICKWNIIPVCYGISSAQQLACSGHGTCDSDDSCSCFEYWGGNAHCNITSYTGKCFGFFANDTSNVCSGHGSCYPNETCICDPNSNYYGENCNITKCFDIFSNISNSCSSHGECVEQDKCICDENYFGNYCNITTCFGSWNNETGNNICNSHGSCRVKDKCECLDNYYGNCNITKCFDIFSNVSNVCYSHGACNEFDHCECHSQYFLEFCNTTICFGVFSNSTDQCSGNGTCISPEKCECLEDFKGEKCNLPKSFPSFILSYPQEAVSSCFIQRISALEVFGEGLTFHWNSPSHPALNSSFVNSPTQFLDFSVLQEVKISSDPVFINISVYAKDKHERSTEETEIALTIHGPNSTVQIFQPNGFIIGPKTRYTNPNNPNLILFSDFEILCDLKNFKIEYYWIQNSGPEIDWSNIARNRSYLEFTNGFPFRSGTSRLQFSVLMNGNATESVWIEVINRGLISKINDSSRTIPFSDGVTLNLDASQSYDPESSNETTKYKWSCLLTDFSPCDNNFISSTILPIITFQPPSSGIFKISMTFQKGQRKDTSNVTLDFRVFEGYTYIPIIWIDPLDGPVPESSKLKLNGRIEPHEKASTDTYFTWSSSQIPNLEDIIMSKDLHQLVLIIKPNSLIHKTTEFILTCTTTENLNISASIKVAKNEAPKPGEIIVSPTSGKVLETKFSIFFQNWKDDSSAAILSYSLQYINPLTNQTRLIQPFTQENEFSFVVSSQGCTHYNYDLKLLAFVSDAEGSTYQEEIIIKVYPTIFKTIFDWMEHIVNKLEVFVSDIHSFDSYQNSKLLNDVLKTINLINPNCSSLGLQVFEEFCMTKSECEVMNLRSTDPYFKRFQNLTIQYLFQNVYELKSSMVDNNQKFQDLYKEKIFRVLQSIELTDRDLEIRVIDLLFLVLSEENEVATKFRFSDSDFAPIFTIINTLASSTSQKVDQLISIFSKKLVRSLSIGEEFSHHLQIKDPLKIHFDQEKDYVSNFVANSKYRTKEKVLDVQNVKITVPSGLKNSFSVLDVMNTFSFMNADRKEVYLFLGTDTQLDLSSTSFLDSYKIYAPSKLQFSLGTRRSAGYICQQYDISIGGYVSCSGQENVGNAIICTCRYWNTKFRITSGVIDDSSLKEDDEEDNDGLAIGLGVGLGLGIPFLIICFLVCVGCCACFVGLFVVLIVLFIVGCFVLGFSGCSCCTGLVGLICGSSSTVCGCGGCLSCCLGAKKTKQKKKNGGSFLMYNRIRNSSSSKIVPLSHEEKEKEKDLKFEENQQEKDEEKEDEEVDEEEDDVGSGDSISSCSSASSVRSDLSDVENYQMNEQDSDEGSEMTSDISSSSTVSEDVEAFSDPPRVVNSEENVTFLDRESSLAELIAENES